MMHILAFIVYLDYKVCIISYIFSQKKKEIGRVGVGFVVLLSRFIQIALPRSPNKTTCDGT